MSSSFFKYIALPLIIVCCATNTQNRIPDVAERKAIRELSAKDLDKKTQQFEEEEKTTYEAYLARYLFAMSLLASAPEQACGEFQQLINDNFWAKELAQIRAHQICSQETLIFQQGEIEALKQKPWYRAEFLKTAYQKSLSKKNELDEMRYGFEMAQFGGRRKDRVKLVQRSVQLAKKYKREVERIAYLSYLYRLSPKYKPKPSSKELMDVADDLRFSREFVKARRLYEKIARNAKKPFTERVKALEGIAKTYKLELDKQENIRTLQRVQKFVELFWRKNPKNRTFSSKLEEAVINVARAQWTEHQVTAAIKTLERGEQLLKKYEPIEQICWIRARIDEEDGRLASALIWLDKGLEQKALSPTYLESLRWQKAWILRKLGRLEEAQSILADLREKALNPFSRAKFSFWSAKIMLQLKKDSEAKDELRDLTKADPYGYYGMLAQKELNEPFDLDELGEDSSTLSSEPSEGFDRVMFTWLIDAKEVEIARRYLEKYLSAHSGLSRQKLEDMGAVGLYNRVYSELSAMDVEARNKFIKENLNFFFPLQYLDHYEKAAQTVGLDKALLLAITRQESGFDPLSRSHADAFGLMQVIPEVAQAVSKEAKYGYAHPEDLYLPEINIPIGAHFISRLLKRFDGAFIPSVSSYNASEAAIRNWIRTRYRGDSTEFIEEIPYEETKTYVKLVMRNFVFYQLLLSPNQQLDFPESCLVTIAGEETAVSQNESAADDDDDDDNDRRPNHVPSPSRFSGL